MKAIRNLLTVVLSIIFAASVAKGDDAAAEFPSPDQIRSHYQNVAADWPTIPSAALFALVAAEDRNFFQRPPQNSTISLQIGRWYSGQKTAKHQKVELSSVIGEALTHDEILNWYGNRVFLGQTCFGVRSAAMAYFGKPVEDLRLEETAFLAALPKAPRRFHPVKSYDRAVERRNFVLSEMMKAGFISELEAEDAKQTPLTVIQPLERCEPEE